MQESIIVLGVNAAVDFDVRGLVVAADVAAAFEVEVEGEGRAAAAAVATVLVAAFQVLF
jgi:hypothetical protein